MTRSATVRKSEHPHVEHRPGVQGGRAVIKGTRFPVSSIVQSYRDGQSVEEILHEFPQLSPAEVHAALAYYYDHPAAIDEEIRALEDVEGAMEETPPTLLPSRYGRPQDLSR